MIIFLVSEFEVVFVQIQDTNKTDFMGNKKRLFWVLIFIIIAVISFLAIISFNKSFSIPKFIEFFKSANSFWMCLAIFSMFLFIFFEGCSISVLCKYFKYRTKLRDGFSYSSADIYFSAITPSATGGQPASAYFMHKDGIPLSVITVTMFCILLMYSLSILLINIVSFIIKPSILFEFDFMARIFIIVGVGVQFVLVTFFYFLLFNENLLYKLCYIVLNFLSRIHLIKDKESVIKKLDDLINKYKDAAQMLKGHNKVMLKVLILTILQRLAQIGVIVFVFIATNGNFNHVFDIFSIESFVISGSYCIPVPGAIGVSDYLMLNGFKMLMAENIAVNLELISRGISFYCCIIVCGVTVLVKYLLLKRSSGK